MIEQLFAYAARVRSTFTGYVATFRECAVARLDIRLRSVPVRAAPKPVLSAKNVSGAA